MAGSVADEVPGTGDSSGRDWANLTSLLLGEILDRLPPLDRCRFRAVCRSWKEEVPQQSIYRPYLKPHHSCHSQLLAQEPWLIVPVKDGIYDRVNFYKLSSPSLFTMNHLPRIGLIAGKSPGGWILHVDDRGDLHALNLFTLEELHAPPFDRSLNWSDEMWTQQMRRWTISHYHMAIIYFPKPSIEGRRYAFFLTSHKWFAWEGEKSWTKTNIDLSPVHDLFPIMIPHNGLIYGIKERLVSSFSLSGSSEVKILDAPFLDKSNSLSRWPRGYENFLVEISSELWVVSKINYLFPFSKLPVEPEPDYFVMYKLDKETNVWSEESNFGEEMALFLDYSYSFALQTRDFPHLQPGCIYFMDNILSDHGIRIYNVEEKALDYSLRYPTRTSNLDTYGWMFP